MPKFIKVPWIDHKEAYVNCSYIEAILDVSSELTNPLSSVCISGWECALLCPMPPEKILEMINEG